MDYLTVREAAARLRISQSLVRYLIRTRRLPARKLRGGRLVRIAVEDLDRLFEPLPPREPRDARETTGA
jgi:excisionase family DNA binding protein